ncbi:MAG: ATP-binding protein [Spirochaetales bacterium]|nr:ATP-binding protein [Spirochaetales bacterium]
MSSHPPSFHKRIQSVCHLFLFDPSLTKTFLAKTITRDTCCKGYSVVFTRIMKMLGYIYSSKADSIAQKKINQFLNPDLLVLDD